MFCSRWKKADSFLFYTFKRNKVSKTHWSVLRKNNHATDKALEHFDDFYGSVFGAEWKGIREALIRRHRYIAVINNYSDNKETMKLLESMGAFNLRGLFEAHKKYLQNIGQYEDEPTSTTPVDTQDRQIAAFASRTSQEEIAGIYSGTDMEVPGVLDTGTTIIGDKNLIQNEANSRNESLQQSHPPSSPPEAVVECERIVEPEAGMSSGALWTFVPCTRLMGKDDWLPESHQFKYYSDAKDFPLVIEEDDSLEFPEHLNVYAFGGEDTTSSFPEPKIGKTGVLNYYLMDGGSLLPVLALGLREGDRVLDLCAAPGGKSLAILQTLRPGVLVANDASTLRVKRIKKVFEEYLYDFDTNIKWRERILISHSDGRFYNSDEFDKVLVDVPCTNDRLSLKENDNNMFKPSRNQERLKLPELQSSLLCGALAACRVGGTVVYSTCSLSPVQNDGVVHLALKTAFEERGIQAVIKLFKNTLKPALSLYRFGQGPVASRYGHLVTPLLEANYGPLYFAKLVRTK